LGWDVYPEKETLTISRAVSAAAAGVAALAYLLVAGAASDVQVTALDCVLHPRKIAIQNKGDTAQSLAGWKLLSDKPNEEFDLSVVGSVGAGETFFVYNGHKSPPAPEQQFGQWIYPWNYTPELVESAFVLTENGTDFIRLVDASQWPWRQVSVKGCETTGEIPPFELPSTPTPAPSNPDQGTGGGNNGGTETNQATSAQTDAGQSTGASQGAATSGTTAGGSGTVTSAQTGNVSGQVVGGPASGVGVLSSSSGQSLARHLLPLGLLGGFAGAALMLIAVRMLSRALRRPQDGA
jgi:hypothetical protein